MKSTRLALASLLIAAAPAAFANTAQVNVTGTITPAACQIALANGGNFDLGVMSSADLNSERRTSLTPQEAQFSVDCNGPTRFVVTGADLNEVDNPNGSVLSFSLGKTSAGEVIGDFTLRLTEMRADNNIAYATFSRDGGVTWYAANDTNANYLGRNERMAAWTTVQGSTAGPGLIESFTAKLTLNAGINATDGLTLDADQAINAGTVLTVEFL